MLTLAMVWASSWVTLMLSVVSLLYSLPSLYLLFSLLEGSSLLICPAVGKRGGGCSGKRLHWGSSCALL